MLSNYYTLVTVAADSDSKIRSMVINEAYTQAKNELVLSFGGMGEGLVISCSPDVNSLYLHPRLARARTNSADVLKEIVGKSIEAVAIQSMDRVIAFSLSGGVTLCAQFFGSKANVLLVDKDQKVIDAFKDARTITGTVYSSRNEEFVHDVDALRSIIKQEPTQTVFVLLKRASPILGSTLASEILFRGKLSISTKAQDITDEELNQLAHSYTTLLTELAQPKPRVYVEKEPPHAPYRFSLVRLEHCHEFDEKLFNDIHEAIRFFVSRRKSTSSLKSHASDIVTPLRQHHTKLQRTIAAIGEDLTNTERAGDYERYANLLMANLGLVKKGMKSVTLPDQAETIPLDSTLTPIQNAQRYFEKVKKSRLAYEQSRQRLAELKTSLRLVNELLAVAETIHTKEELKALMADRAEDLERFGIGEKAKEREQLPFRIFNVDGGFEVWAGKSSRNNDELTMKHAKPNDLWFHARGASGSHVILKTSSGKGEPGKKAKTQAASIAAYYSKMKNATMVPVAMTEKKYVRKPKGAPAGTVVLEREKVIFAEPALPDNKPENE